MDPIQDDSLLIKELNDFLYKKSCYIHLSFVFIDEFLEDMKSSLLMFTSEETEKLFKFIEDLEETFNDPRYTLSQNVEEQKKKLYEHISVIRKGHLNDKHKKLCELITEKGDLLYEQTQKYHTTIDDIKKDDLLMKKFSDYFNNIRMTYHLTQIKPVRALSRPHSPSDYE
jgi:hypothetical protein